jgi:hypothetical protein
LFVAIKMSEVMLVAIAAAIGNLLQGWDNSTIAGILSLIIYVYVRTFDICLDQTAASLFILFDS